MTTNPTADTQALVQAILQAAQSVTGGINSIPGVSSIIPWVTPQEFQAKADGITDDAASVQAAVNALPASGGIVFFPPGTYLFGSQIVLKNNTRFIGGGTASILKVGNATTNIFSNFNANYLNVIRLSNISFENLSFDGNYNAFGDPLNDNLSYGVLILYSDNITVKHCIFKNFWYDAVNMFGSRSFNVSENIFQNCGDKNTYLGYYRGIAFDSAATGSIYGGSTGIINKNIIQNCGVGIGANLSLDLGFDFTISDNIIQTTKIQGISIIDGGVQRLSILNNKIYQAGDSGIYLSTNNSSGTHPNYLIKEAIIQGNLIDSPSFINAGAIGIRADGVYLLNISDNKILNINQATARGVLIGQAYEQDGTLKTTNAPIVERNQITSTTATDGIYLNANYTRCKNNVITGTFSGSGVNIVSGTGNLVEANYIPVTTPYTDGGTNTDVINNRISSDPMTGQFTLSAAATFTINNQNILPNNVNRIVFFPVNPSAALLEGSSKKLYFTSVVAYTSFTLKTGDGTNAAGTEVFYYVIY